MDEQRRRAAVEAMTMVQEDVFADTARREGLPFTGPNVSEALGEICAQVGAVARAVQLLLEEHAPSEEQAPSAEQTDDQKAMDALGRWLPYIIHSLSETTYERRVHVISQLTSVPEWLVLRIGHDSRLLTDEEEQQYQETRRTDET